MKNVIIALAALAAAELFGGTGATTDWVKDYVSKAISNSVSQITSTAKTESTATADNTSFSVEGFTFVLSCEKSTEPAISLKSVTPYGTSIGFSKGELFALDREKSAYVNTTHGEVEVTDDGFVWNGHPSELVNGAAWLTGEGGKRIGEIQFFKIQPSVARKVKGE